MKKLILVSSFLVMLFATALTFAVDVGVVLPTMFYQGGLWMKRLLGIF